MDDSYSEFNILDFLFHLAFNQVISVQIRDLIFPLELHTAIAGKVIVQKAPARN